MLQKHKRERGEGVYVKSASAIESVSVLPGTRCTLLYLTLSLMGLLWQAPDPERVI